MIDPPSRHRKKPIAATNAASTSRNLKLICRFNGSFQIIESQQSFKNVRYIGGETRIISVDRRSINFSKLCFRISQMCPNVRSFSLKYHLPSISRSGLGSECVINGNSKGKDLSPLVSISSDDDVFCMITEYDKLELYGKQNVRLWIYVLSSSSDSISGNQCDYMRHKLFLAKQCPLGPRNGNSYTNCVGNVDDLRVNLMCDRVDYGNENMNSREDCLAWSMGCYRNGIRNQRVYSYRNSNHHYYNHHQSGRLDGRVVSAGKCHHGLKPKPNISKQGQSLRSYFCSNSKRSLGNSREKSGSDVSLFENLAYFSASCGADAGNQHLLSCNSVEGPSSVVENMECQQDLLTGSPYKPHEVSLHSDSENNYAASVSDKLTFGHQNVVSNSSNGPSVECNKELIDNGEGTNLLSHLKNDTHNLKIGVASSLELLDNLSLSSKEVKPSAPTVVIGDVLSSLLKPKSEHLDILDGNISAGYKAGKLGVVKSNPYALHATEVEKAETKEEIKRPSVMDVISDDLATGQLQAIRNSDLEHIKELGSGTYGTVYHGKWKGSDVAIKRIKPSCFIEDSSAKDRLVIDFWKEAHILAQLHHPNIVAFYGVVTDGPAKSLGTVTEYMVNGSLKQVLRRKDRTIDRRKRIILAMDAAFGMEYLHEKNIVHFDLKSPNLLVNMRDPQKPVCKIGDLGLSKIKKRTLVSGGVRGTIPWMAPELLNSKNKLVTEKVDVYSFGIIMWELLTGEEPYAQLRSEEIIAGIIKGSLRPEIPSWCEPAWRSLMERCWSSDPGCRPAFLEIAKELRGMSAAMNIK
ncbi:uncharacterized protein LOC126684744 [Mercurialis annua]|uniref:uncharacterized protein LOC126684744 n=1 Tax=Mercurialis annua TaxID=3986 RepID=UPI002160C7BF|nr:uncharacterized protein LOC126684744 [Mercurialis annua]